MGRFSYLFPVVNERLIGQIIKNEEEFIKDLNRDQMYKEGIMNVDTEKKEGYAESTIRAKKRKAKYRRTDHITLRWMGDFYDSLRVLIFDKWFTINADSTIWARFLEPQERFTKALGLTEDSKEKLRERIRDRIIIWLRTRR